MKNITYVTGNYGKYISVKEQFEKQKIEIGFFRYDIDEPNVNDINFISKEKARIAYEKLNEAVFVIDSGFYIEDYPNNPGYPGAFVKRTGISSDIDTLLDTMRNTKNRKCYFLDCLTFYDGEDYYQFFGKTEGFLSSEKKGVSHKSAKSNLWYVFVPNNFNKTLAEMNDDEREILRSNKISATTEFINWYKDSYLNQKKLIK